ncbi:NADH dehydrogenase 1 alpha subcomplex 9, partial [Phakopsora pachyrhizi]
QRFQHDLVRQSATAKVIQSSGPSGRHSNSGLVATVFGATGFLGRYLVHKLAKKGTQVIVPYREEDSKRHLRVMGDLGQIVPLEFDLQNETSINECVRHSHLVYNLIGRDYETKNYSFDSVFVDGAAKITQITKDNGVNRLIHISHLNASHDSPSKFYRAKASGEDKVKSIFPDVTIVRPSTFFGQEDRFLNKMVTKPFTFNVNRLETITRPVHVLDVAEAISLMGTAQSTVGKTFELAGPRTYSYEDLFETLENLTLKSLTPSLNLPLPIFKLFNKIVSRAVWWPTLSEDEIVRRCIDDKEELSEGALGFDYFGIEPDLVEDAAITYLRFYRSALVYSASIHLLSSLKIIACILLNKADLSPLPVLSNDLSQLYFFNFYSPQCQF